MGCCASSTSSETAINNNPNSSSTTQAKKAGGKEDKIELAFKAKRANVFTQGVDLERPAFNIKRTQKSESVSKIICKSYRKIIQ
jgi:hypothetical protein